MGADIDDLIDRLEALDSEERRELSRRMRADWVQRVEDAQRAYLDRLEEENLVGGGGSVFQPIPGEEAEWVEYCRDHPNDPICLLGAPPAVGDRLSDFLEIREEYLSHLEEEGLLDVESSSGGGIRPAGGTSRPAVGYRGDPSPQPSLRTDSPVGLTPPPDPWPWPPQWPPWPWPWPGPGPRPGPWPYADNGDPVPLPMDRAGRDDGWASLRGPRRMAAVDPRRLTPGSGAATARRGLTVPPDEWPPWPWPWPWPGPRPDPWPVGGDPIPFPASRW
ncbi:hypothetical protein [Haloplanus halophilus]|uniref:hypothetical protein n=1 Tax=Haloplanus halophilus TaxID=2949993 RepID=UPI00203E4961|nr:hypothetical protein [Haloplanus sp. GDY1]